MKRLLICLIIGIFGLLWVSSVGAIDPVHTQGSADETYGSGWNADTSCPEKDDIYDYLHLMDTDDDGDIDTLDADVSGTTISAKDSQGHWICDDSGTTCWHIDDDGNVTVASGVTVIGNLAAATYGSTGELSDAELLYGADVTGLIQAQIDGKEPTVTEGSLADQVIVSADIKQLTILNADIASGASIVITKLAVLWVDDTSAVTDTCTYTPPFGKRVRCFLTAVEDPSGVTISEVGRVDGDELLVYNSGVSEIQFSSRPADTSTTQQLPYTIYLGQGEMAEFVYMTDRLVLGDHATRKQEIDTINAKTKTYSVSGRAGTTQLDDVATPYVLLDAEIAGTYILHDSAVTASYTFPDADPGTGQSGEQGIIMIGVSGATVTVTSGTTCLVNGTATAGATGASITTSTPGEYFVFMPYFDVGASDWRWAFRTKDD